MVFLSCDLSWFARSDSISGSQFTRNLISNQENLRSNPLNSISFHSIHRTDDGDTPDHTLMIETGTAIRQCRDPFPACYPRNLGIFVSLILLSSYLLVLGASGVDGTNFLWRTMDSMSCSGSMANIARAAEEPAVRRWLSALCQNFD